MTLSDHVEILRLNDASPFIIGTDLFLRPIFGGGNAGDNLILGNSADNVLDGGPGNDTLVGGFLDEEGDFLTDGDDILIGGAGDDVLERGYVVGSGIPDPDNFGSDTMVGGPGNDTYLLFNPGYSLGPAALSSLLNVTIIEAPDEGSDTVVAGFDYTLGPNVENLTLLGSGSYRGTGNELANVLVGNSGSNALEGAAGDDTLMGGFGQSQFDDAGDDGVADTLIGGVGNDTYVLNSVQDVIVEQVGEGMDTVASRVSYALGANVENLSLSGNAAISGTGNALPNVLIGNVAANVLAGAVGNDQFSGGAGDDTYLFNLGDGVDSIRDTAAPGEGNRIRFGAGIAQSDLTLLQSGTTLTIHVGTGGDAIHLLNFDPTNVNGSLVVEKLEFFDGSQLSLVSLLAPAPTGGDDILTFGSGDDVINALGGNDVVDAGTGNDTITGGSGNDALTGGAGDDTYIFNLGDGVDTINDTALAGEGNTLQFGAGIAPADLSLGLGSLLLRVGSDGDAIHLTTFDPDDAYGPHTIGTFRFADGTVSTYSQLIDRGFDLAGTADNDTMTGTNVVDRITGLAGSDVIESGPGNDVLDGGGGADTLMGGQGNDTYVVDDVDDVVKEDVNEGTDTVQSSINYTLGANVESLTLIGTANLNGIGNTLNNILTGNGGNNALDGQVGADTMVGGAGDDTYFVDNMSDVVTENANEGTDSVLTAVSYQLSANVENLTLTGTASINGTGNAGNNVLTGNGVANTLDGGAGDDALLGGSGNDTLLGGTGNDRLDGGTGTDAMTGGIGNDTYVVDAAGDTVTEAADEGTDTVESAITYTLGVNVENLTLTGAAASSGTGNGRDNILLGNSGNNILSGGAGNDTLNGGAGANVMSGGAGDDIYVVDNAGDTVSESSNQGADTVQSSITYTLGSNVENLTLTGAANINGTGNSLNNVLTGNSGNNQLDGGSGNDTMVGGDGNDSLLGGSGDDTLHGGVGDDWLNAGSGNDLLNGGDGADVLDAGSGDDVLFGGAGNDTLLGGSGNDQLTGGIGNDLLRGGSGNDTYSVSGGDGADTISENDATPVNSDKLLYGTGINPIDLIISQQANDLRITMYGSTDQTTIQNWYASTNSQVETIQAGNGQQLLNTKVNQLIQAMASFGAQTGLTWEQAIAQRPQDVQNILAANWQ